MSAQLIDGKTLSAAAKLRVKEEVDNLKKKGIQPGLAVILVGEDPASQIYVRNKERGCEEVGIRSYSIKLPRIRPRRSLRMRFAASTLMPMYMASLCSCPFPGI